MQITSYHYQRPPATFPNRRAVDLNPISTVLGLTSDPHRALRRMSAQTCHAFHYCFCNTMCSPTLAESTLGFGYKNSAVNDFLRDLYLQGSSGNRMIKNMVESNKSWHTKKASISQRIPSIFDRSDIFLCLA